MRIAPSILALALTLPALAVPAQGIADVLLRSQQMRLARFDVADPQRDEAQRIRATLARLNTAAAAPACRRWHWCWWTAACLPRPSLAAPLWR